MVTNPSRRYRDASIAVIRDYQPVRIERELLAKVFDVVGSVARQPGGRFEKQISAVQAPLDRTLDSLCEPSCEDESFELQSHVMGAVA